MESVNVAGVLEEAGDAHSRVCPRSLFFTLPHPLDCLICDKDIVVIVVTANDRGDGKVGAGGGYIILASEWGDRGLMSYFFSFLLFFVLLLIVLSWLVHDNFVSFLVPLLHSLSLVSFIRC